MIILKECGMENIHALRIREVDVKEYYWKPPHTLAVKTDTPRIIEIDHDNQKDFIETMKKLDSLFKTKVL